MHGRWHEPSNDGLFSDAILEIIEDEHGYIWMSSVGGVFRIAKKDCDDFDAGRISVIPCSSFGKAEGMHDDLGARLTEVLMVSEDATRVQGNGGEVRKQLSRITHVARELIDNMDAIVWAVTPQNDTLDKLVLYISEFASTFLDTAGIRYRISAPNSFHTFHCHRSSATTCSSS